MFNLSPMSNYVLLIPVAVFVLYLLERVKELFPNHKNQRDADYAYFLPSFVWPIAIPYKLLTVLMKAFIFLYSYPRFKLRFSNLSSEELLIRYEKVRKGMIRIRPNLHKDEFKGYRTMLPFDDVDRFKGEIVNASPSLQLMFYLGLHEDLIPKLAVINMGLVVKTVKEFTDDKKIAEKIGSDADQYELLKKKTLDK
jgi:hypothetical protein